MTIDLIVISGLPGDRRAAAFSDNEIVRLVFAGQSMAPRPGDIFVGRITRTAPAMGAAFVDLGYGRDGLLMAADATKGRLPPEGSAAVVRVLRAAEPGKGPKLSQRQPLPATLRAAAEDVQAPCRLQAAPEPILALVNEAAASGTLQKIITDDAESAAQLRALLPKDCALQSWMDPRPLLSAYAIDEAIDAALSTMWPLPSGGRMHIEETSALVAVDVDTGAAITGGAAATALAVNLEAAEALGRALQLRELAGRIVIDFVPMARPRDRERVLTTLLEAATTAGRVLRVGGWTRLGLLELSRERRVPSLRMQLTEPCPQCPGGRRKAAWLVAGEALRAVLAASRLNPGYAVPASPLRLHLAPHVQAALQDDMAPAFAAAQARIGVPLLLIVDPEVAEFRLG